MLRAICLLILLLAPQACVLADSNPPSPSPSENSQPEKKNSEAAPQPSSDDQRGTEKFPIFVKVLPPEKTEQESAQAREDRDTKAAEDQQLVTYSWVLDIVTGILAIIGFLQLGTFTYQAIQLRRTVASMEAQSKDMKAHISKSARSATATSKLPPILRL